MGKSTFVEDVLVELESAGVALTARGRCSERLAEANAFAPVFEALDGLRRGEPAGPVVELLRTAAPVWHAQLDHIGGNDTVRTASQEGMRREFRAFFEALSWTRPVVLFLDDMHWALPRATCWPTWDHVFEISES